MKKKSGEKKAAGQQKRGIDFATELLHWNKYENNREMPWKGEKDPYKIWLSEIILQQTRVEQGLKYYQNFIQAFPDIQALAAAPEAKVFKLWEGLGYYSRCRNLIITAKYISEELNGVFPSGYEAILALKGVGTYTASAIASFAYNLPHAVLDGNVFRVLARIFDIETAIDTTAGKKEFSSLAQAILPTKKAGEYNQAIMDFGAVICRPVPLCQACFFNSKCLAYLTGKQDLLPVKEKKIKVTKRWFNYFIIQSPDEFLIQQRTGKDIWRNLHQFVLIESAKTLKKSELENLLSTQYGFEKYTFVKDWKESQVLSHQVINFHFIHLRVSRRKMIKNFSWMKLTHLHEIAFPKTLQKVVQHYLP